MCVVSMIMDHYNEKWKQYPQPSVPVYPFVIPTIPFPQLVPSITPEEIAEFRKLLERAREYDKQNGEPACELDEKKEALKKLAKELGVEIAFV